MSSELRFRNPGFSSHSWASSSASLSPTPSESLGSGAASRAQEGVPLPADVRSPAPWPGRREGHARLCPLPPVSDLCPQLVAGSLGHMLTCRKRCTQAAGQAPPIQMAWLHTGGTPPRGQPGSAKGSGMASEGSAPFRVPSGPSGTPPASLPETLHLQDPRLHQALHGPQLSPEARENRARPRRSRDQEAAQRRAPPRPVAQGERGS